MERMIHFNCAVNTKLVRVQNELLGNNKNLKNNILSRNSVRLYFYYAEKKTNKKWEKCFIQTKKTRVGSNTNDTFLRDCQRHVVKYVIAELSVEKKTSG